MTITVEQLRRKYPEPVKSSPEATANPASYCVGGALALELGCYISEGSSVSSPGQANQGRVGAPSAGGVFTPNKGTLLEMGMFPDPAVLAALLIHVNPGLSSAAGDAFAETIVRKNDTGNFETAWGLLSEALSWTEPWTDADDAALREFAGLSA